MTTAVAVDATITTGPFTVEARFEAGPGITALFGPSGAGKSVTLAAIAGLLRPAAGWVAIDGEVVADTTRAVHVPTQQRRLGMVFQHAALLTHRSPLDNVGLAVRSGPSASRRQEARRWLDRVHAGHLAASRTATLSGWRRAAAGGARSRPCRRAPAPAPRRAVQRVGPADPPQPSPPRPRSRRRTGAGGARRHARSRGHHGLRRPRRPVRAWSHPRDARRSARARRRRRGAPRSRPMSAGEDERALGPSALGRTSRGAKT